MSESRASLFSFTQRRITLANLALAAAAPRTTKRKQFEFCGIERRQKGGEIVSCEGGRFPRKLGNLTKRRLQAQYMGAGGARSGPENTFEEKCALVYEYRPAALKRPPAACVCVFEKRSAAREAHVQYTFRNVRKKPALGRYSSCQATKKTARGKREMSAREEGFSPTIRRSPCL